MRLLPPKPANASNSKRSSKMLWTLLRTAFQFYPRGVRAVAFTKSMRGGYVAVVVRDNITKTQSPISNQKQSIEDNTDFKNIWYGACGCTRFFYSRDLVKLWRTNQYRNSSFEDRGQPDTRNCLGLTWVSRWTLPHKATIVWPIRYLPEGRLGQR
jgi:hypothetical protein